MTPQDTTAPLTEVTTNAIPAALFGARDAGGYIGVSEATVWRLVRAGELAVTRIGGRTLIPRAELDRLIAERTELAS